MKPVLTSLLAWERAEFRADAAKCKAPAPCDCFPCSLKLAPDSPFKGAIRIAADRMYRRLIRHQERYVKAWIAATGLRPTECELVQKHMPDGAVVMYVRKRSEGNV